MTPTATRLTPAQLADVEYRNALARMTRDELVAHAKSLLALEPVAEVLDAKQREIEALRSALEPFAKAWLTWDASYRTEFPQHPASTAFMNRYLDLEPNDVWQDAAFAWKKGQSE